jgi:hypothetical protein
LEHRPDELTAGAAVEGVGFAAFSPSGVRESSGASALESVAFDGPLTPAGGLVWNESGQSGSAWTNPRLYRGSFPRWGFFAKAGAIKLMDEREFFNETTETRTHTLTCPKCGQPSDYKVTWVVRRKRAQLPRHADERDRAKFAKAQSYMVRRDDKLSCQNMRCRKPFEITGLQTLAFLND